MLIFIFYFLFNCQSSSIHSLEEYVAYINKPSNGLVQIKIANGLKITVKYLPPVYLAYLEIAKQNSNDSSLALDSLVSVYSGSQTFQVTIESDEVEVPLATLLHRKVRSQADLTDNITTLNYEMDQFVQLNGRRPGLSILESGLTNDSKLSLLFVFEKELGSLLMEKIQNLVIENVFFLDAPVLFTFHAEDLNQIPEIEI